MKNIHFYLFKKNYLCWKYQIHFLGMRAGIIVDANIGNKKLNIPDPFWFKVIFY